MFRILIGKVDFVNLPFINISWISCKYEGEWNQKWGFRSIFFSSLKSHSDKIPKHFITYLFFLLNVKYLQSFFILFQLRRCCWKRTRKDFMAAKLVVTNPGSTLTFVGILNPAMSILKSPAFSVTLYLKPIVLIENMWNGTIQQKYYLSTGKLGNDIKK